MQQLVDSKDTIGLLKYAQNSAKAADMLIYQARCSLERLIETSLSRTAPDQLGRMFCGWV